MSKKALAKTVPRPSPVPGSFSWFRLCPYAALAALAFGVYANSLPNGFVSDDNAAFYSDPVAMSWRGIPDLFRRDFVKQFDPRSSSNYYRPVQILVYVLMFHLTGRDAFSMHLLSILVHVINTLLVFHLGRRWLTNENAALMAAALFAVHPIHSEVVVWAAALPDGILTLVVLATLCLFDLHEASPRRWQIAAIVVSY